MEKAHNELLDIIGINQYELWEKPEKLSTDREFLEILAMNMEVLSQFLEERILDNPFVEMDYYLEQFAETLKESSDNDEENPDDDELAEENDLNKVTFHQSLESYLYEQIMLYRYTSIRDVMLQLVELLDENGFLPYTLEQLTNQLNIDKVLVLDGLTLFKGLEPTGIGAYDIREALMLQTDQDELAPDYAYLLLDKYYKEVTEGNFDTIISQLKINEETIQVCLKYYQTLRLIPTEIFNINIKGHSIPDVKVIDIDQKIMIQYNRKSAARIFFNQKYYDEMVKVADAELDKYLKEQVEKYSELAIKIRQREELLMQISSILVSEQSEFFINNNQNIKPLTVRDIAKKMQLPEGYIYRLLMNKKLEYQEKIYSYSDFINLMYSVGRDGLSSVHIKDRIKKILNDSEQDLTDQAVVEQLKVQGIMISSKLVALYRENL